MGFNRNLQFREDVLWCNAYSHHPYRWGAEGGESKGGSDEREKDGKDGREERDERAERESWVQDRLKEWEVVNFDEIGSVRGERKESEGS